MSGLTPQRLPNWPGPRSLPSGWVDNFRWGFGRASTASYDAHECARRLSEAYLELDLRDELVFGMMLLLQLERARVAQNPGRIIALTEIRGPPNTTIAIGRRVLAIARGPASPLKATASRLIYMARVAFGEGDGPVDLVTQDYDPGEQPGYNPRRRRRRD